jgi:hypothetical protein
VKGCICDPKNVNRKDEMLGNWEACFQVMVNIWSSAKAGDERETKVTTVIAVLCFFRLI